MNPKSSPKAGRSPARPSATTKPSTPSAGIEAPQIHQKVPDARGSRKILTIALGVSILWLGLLMVMAAFTANPVHLNQLQILQADFVITAEVLDASTGKLRVEHEYRFVGTAHWKDRELTVPNLPKGSYQQGQLYLVPLSQTNLDQFKVTEPQYANGPAMAPRVYPATEDTIKDLEALLEKKAEE